MSEYDDIGFPNTHLIHGIANRNVNTATLCGEIVDNSFGAAAGNAKNVWIELRTDRAIFIDDGVGMADIWKLFELGGHLHDPNKTAFDIGHYGQGAKDALLSLGWKVTVQTVRNGVFHQHSVDWLPIANAASPLAWPKRYRGDGKPARSAPKAIREGGTIVTVTKLHDGRRLPTIDSLRMVLGRNFKPALREGRKIFIKVGARAATLDTPELVRVDNRIEANGEVRGMAFSIVAGALLETGPINRVFYGFGHRVLNDEGKLCGEALPPLFTCDVTLGPAWKPHLQTNKQGIAAYREELQAAIFELVREVWNETKAISDEARVENINAKLSRATRNVLRFHPKGDTHAKGDEAEVAGDGGGANDPSPNAGPNKDHSARPGGTEGGATPKRPRASGIKYRKLDEMDDNYAVMVVADLHGIEVRLNGKVPAIDYAYSRPFKVEAVWPTISHGIANYLVTNPAELDVWLPEYETLLGVNMDDPNELEERLFTFLLRQQPIGEEAKAFEPKAADIS